MRIDDFFAADLERQEAIFQSPFPRTISAHYTRDEAPRSDVIHHCACGAVSPSSRGIGIHIGHKNRTEAGQHYRVKEVAS